MTEVRRISVVLITIGLWSCDDPSERTSAADIQSMTSSPTDVAGMSAQLAAGRPGTLGNMASIGGRLANGSPSAGGLQRPVVEPPSAGRQVVIAGLPSTGGQHGVTGLPQTGGQVVSAGQPSVTGRIPLGGQRRTGGQMSSAGQPTSGGQTSAGGQPQTGGRILSAGMPASGGQTSAGGQPHTGGQSALGGQTSAGGQPHTGGQSALGGQVVMSPCAGEADGIVIAAGQFGVCFYDDACTEIGAKRRVNTVCENGQLVTREEHSHDGCTRETDGNTIAEADFGACSYGSVCAQSGLKQRISQVCVDGMLTERMGSSADGCQRTVCGDPQTWACDVVTNQPICTCRPENGPCLVMGSANYDAARGEMVARLTNLGREDAINIQVGVFVGEHPDRGCNADNVDGQIVIESVPAQSSVEVRSSQGLNRPLATFVSWPGVYPIVMVADWVCALSPVARPGHRIASLWTTPDPTTLTRDGLHGYIGSRSSATPASHRFGATFYSAIWPLIERPLSGFQIGLPGTWFTPDNFDNPDQPLCPVGTVARDNWPERAPTYRDVFQTVEGGLGYWAGNRFRYESPKFSMNATPDCYTNQIASPGWPFFNRTRPLSDRLLGIAQLSNRLIIPPDGLPFEGQPTGELLGYGYIALPLTRPRTDPQPTGEQSWTLFLNAANFKGPVAYYLPETWSRISRDFPFDEGRGLDTRRVNSGLAGSMEINTVPQFQSTDESGTLYTKIPQLRFPMDETGKTILVRDIVYYAKDAFYHDVAAWRDGGDTPDLAYPDESIFRPSVSTNNVRYSQSQMPIEGINEQATPTIFEGNVFGLQWADIAADGIGRMPQYFRDTGNGRIAVNAEDVPQETFLHAKTFEQGRGGLPAYTALPLAGAWASPGPADGEYQASLRDCTRVTYRWYRFIDQPVFQQYTWTDAQKAELQSLVEKMHRHWTIDRDYIRAPGGGTLATLDRGLVVTPPQGLEEGYVPVVVHQEAVDEQTCLARASQPDGQVEALAQLTTAHVVGRYQRQPVTNDWHVGEVVVVDGELWWRNNAGVSWTLRADLGHGRLIGGADNPYPGQDFLVRLGLGSNGDVIPTVNRLVFGQDVYVRIGPQSCGLVGGVNGCDAPLCGNAQVEAGEDCDDGNQASLDGCDAQCTREVGLGACIAFCRDGNTVNSADDVSCNQHLSCRNACQLIDDGASVEECANYCGRPDNSGCSLTVRGRAYLMCGPCQGESRNLFLECRQGCRFSP